jgi:hypothetical protein
MPGMEAPEAIAKPFAAVMSVVLMTASSLPQRIYLRLRGNSERGGS